LGIKPTYYHQIINGNTSNTLRLEHLENLLEKKGVNPIWVMTGQGDMFLAPKENADQGTSHEQGTEPPVVNKKATINSIIRYSNIPTFPGDLAYDILDNLVSKTITAQPDFLSQGQSAIEILSLSWLSMLELVQHILDQDIDFQYGEKKYHFRPE
jgi:hypothetical protein